VNGEGVRGALVCMCEVESKWQGSSLLQFARLMLIEASLSHASLQDMAVDVLLGVKNLRGGGD